MRTAIRPYDLAEFLAEAHAALDEGRPLHISVEDGADLKVPTEVARAVVNLLVALHENRAVHLTTLPEEITTGQAADLLGVSRPTVVSLVDQGRIPSRRIGTHRRLRTDDVLAFIDRTRRSRGKALDDLTAISEDLGHYDD